MRMISCVGRREEKVIDNTLGEESALPCSLEERKEREGMEGEERAVSEHNSTSSRLAQGKKLFQFMLFILRRYMQLFEGSKGGGKKKD